MRWVATGVCSLSTGSIACRSPAGRASSTSHSRWRAGGFVAIGRAAVCHPRPLRLVVLDLSLLSPLFAPAALALTAMAAAMTDRSALDGWGLARVLGAAAWASLLCAVAACVAELCSPRRQIPLLATTSGVLILCSTGTPVVEPVARFSTVWLLAGFTDAIAHDGVAPAGMDARFWWPAFFAQWAFFRDAGRATQLDSVSPCGRPAAIRSMLWSGRTRNAVAGASTPVAVVAGG